MTVKITILIFILILLGAIVDYVKDRREKQRLKNKKEIIRLQSIMFRVKRLLNGISLLPLTVVSTIVCLERILVALNNLIALKSAGNLQDVKADIQRRLANFRAQSTDGYIYSLLPMPYTENELQAMLKQSLQLAMILKVDQHKGYIPANVIQDELEQLSILKERLMSAIFNKHAMQALERKHYEKALSLNNQSITILLEIKSNDENVVDLINITVKDIQLVNEGVAGVIQEKSHDFYEKHKEEARLPEEDIHERDDGLGRLLSNSY